MISSPSRVIVDAHHHFWNPARFPQPWMTHDHHAIDRRFEPPDLEPLLRASGVIATVLVQSAADDRDTDYLFEQITRAPWVRAVVAWLQLDGGRASRERLSELQARPRFRGVRHLINREADPHWLLGSAVTQGLELLEEEGVLLELPAEFPNHLADVPELARRHPGLTIVIDHLAKPPLGRDGMQLWGRQIAAASAFPNVHAKVSGLVARRRSVDPRLAVQTALERFGSDRLMFGSDWPMALLGDTYERVVARMCGVIEEVAQDDAAAILGHNARRLYRMEDEPLAQ